MKGLKIVLIVCGLLLAAIAMVAGFVIYKGAA